MHPLPVFDPDAHVIPASGQNSPLPPLGFTTARSPFSVEVALHANTNVQLPVVNARYAENPTSV